MQARRTQQGGGLQRRERWARSRKILAGGEKKRSASAALTSEKLLWDELLTKITNEHLEGLLIFARDCGAKIIYHASTGWRIEAREALGGVHYPAWREAMMPHLGELRAAFASLPAPRRAEGRADCAALQRQYMMYCASCGRAVEIGQAVKNIARALWCEKCSEGGVFYA